MRKLVFLFFIYLFFSTPALAQSVDILWQGTGYIPPFYEGKMLWAKQSVITLVAIPQGLGNPANLNYKWTRNGTVLGNVSGIGKNSLTFMDAVFSKPYTIKVEIVDGNEETRAEATQVIAARDPLLLVYENHPLYGYLFNKEIGGVFKMNKEEATFTAFPLFAQQRAGAYSWRANSGEPSGGNTVTYRAPEGASGVSRVNVSFSDGNAIMRPIERSFLIQFGNE